MDEHDDDDLADLAGLRVLLVEDEDDARELLAHVLVDCGAEVRDAASCAAAIDVMARWIPDVLVSDIGLPEEDGYALIRKVRALPKAEGGAVPAIALTAHAALQDSHAALQAGYQVHVAKPVDPWMLTHAVANVAGLPVGDVRAPER